jgi:hypothetical protein
MNTDTAIALSTPSLLLRPLSEGEVLLAALAAILRCKVEKQIDEFMT